MATRVWHISGANTGLGLELALKAVKEGDKVVAAVRTPSKAPASLQRPEIKILHFDLSWKQDQMDAYAKEAFAAFGRIDVMVNNAGYAYMGAIEESEDAAVAAQFETNVFSMIRVIKGFLPHMRAQGSGLFLNLSSIGGLHGYASNGIYCATKYAVEGFTQALNEEIEVFGLRAAIVEPGYFRTAFLANPSSGANLAPAMDVYEGTPAHAARAAFAQYNGKQPGNPAKGVARIYEYATGTGMFAGKKQLFRLPLGTDSGSMMKSYSEELAENAAHYEDAWRSTDFKDGE